MPRTFDGLAASPAGVDQIYAAFGREDYWAARLAGDTTTTLDSLTADDDGTIAVQLTQHLGGRLLSGVFSKFVPADVTLIYAERWSPDGEAQVHGRISAVVSGGLGSCEGDSWLSPRGTGSQMRFTGTVAARIPLVGGQIEKTISTSLAENIPAVMRFTTTWIAENA